MPKPSGAPHPNAALILAFQPRQTVRDVDGGVLHLRRLLQNLRPGGGQDQPVISRFKKMAAELCLHLPYPAGNRRVADAKPPSRAAEPPRPFDFKKDPDVVPVELHADPSAPVQS